MLLATALLRPLLLAHFCWCHCCCCWARRCCCLGGAAGCWGCLLLGCLLQGCCCCCLGLASRCCGKSCGSGLRQAPWRLATPAVATTTDDDDADRRRRGDDGGRLGRRRHDATAMTTTTTTRRRRRRCGDDASTTTRRGLPLPCMPDCWGAVGGPGFQRRCDAMQAEHAGQRSEHGDDATMTMRRRRRRRRGDDGVTTARRARIAVRMRIAGRIRSDRNEDGSSAPLYDSYRPQFET